MAVVVLGVILAPQAGQGQGYVGAERCRKCHEFEYRVWASGPHAGAHKKLTGDQLSDSKCNTCHTMVPERLDAAMLGVQCERCHGAGRYYYSDFVMKDKELARAVGLNEPTASHCEQCHTEGAPGLDPFDFTSMWADIDHGAEARKKWQAGQGSTPAAGKDSGS